MQGAGKTNVMLAVFLLMMLLLLQEGEASGWSYDDADDWPTLFPNYCSGELQSPINIKISKTKVRGYWPLNFENYDKLPREQIIVNNGHSVSVMPSCGIDPPSVTKGGLGATYKFHSFHFHWGSDASTIAGSEHTINRKRYPMELHLIHVKEEYYIGSGLSEALEHSDGLAVFGVMFEISETDNPALAPLIDSFVDITVAETHVTRTDMYALSSLLPRDLSRFFRYEGGLTTPTCNEVVVWTVFKDTIEISLTQLEKFRGLKDSHDHAIENNFRPTQHRNKRTVYRSYWF